MYWSEMQQAAAF